jgi:hypothetical protein
MNLQQITQFSTDIHAVTNLYTPRLVNVNPKNDAVGLPLIFNMDQLHPF